MDIKIGVYDADEYAGVVEFELKPLPREKILITDIFGDKIGAKNSQKRSKTTTPPYLAV